MLILLAGCGAGTVATVTKPDDAIEPLVGIDFPNWPTVTPKPIPVDPNIFLFCRPPIPDYETKAKTHGPHFKPFIIIRVNPEAINTFKARKPLPVGSAVVKEKHDIDLASGPPHEYAAMIKREAGYDTAHGDWEYQYVVRGKPETITSGKLGSCIDCHANKADQDYLFRTYLPAAPPPANGIK